MRNALFVLSQFIRFPPFVLWSGVSILAKKGLTLLGFESQLTIPQFGWQFIEVIWVLS